MAEQYSQTFHIEGSFHTNAGKASTEIKTILKQLGVQQALIRRAAIMAYEAEMNVFMYAKEATMTFEVSPETISIKVEDRGPGIPDIELAMREGYSTATAEMRELGFGAGMGLPNIKKNSDTFSIESEVGVGTTLRMTIAIT
jgi:anti-sigma regulatory factor (Ser/Thr protein kinase)